MDADDDTPLVEWRSRRQASEKLPEWLPDGWIMEIRRRKDGRSDKYYTSPVSGRTFRSGAAVLQYLNFEKDDGLTMEESCFQESFSGLTPPREEYLTDNFGYITPQNVTSSEDGSKVALCQNTSWLVDNALAIRLEPTDCEIDFEDTQQLDLEGLLGWLPKGWIIEIRIQKHENKERKYKCYVDPVTQSRFYTKEDVLHYLRTGETYNCTFKWEMDEFDMILSQIECTPKGFPAGWIKELKIRPKASGLRKDPYYSDPVSGYVFRTRKDAFHFLETGEPSKHATKPRDAKVINALNNIRERSPPTITRSMTMQPLEDEVRKCLLAHQLPRPVDMMIDQDASTENFEHPLSQCEIAALKFPSLTGVSSPDENSSLIEYEKYRQVEVDVSLPRMSPKSPLPVVNLLDEGPTETRCPEENKPPKSPERKQLDVLDLAENFWIELNCALGPDMHPHRIIPVITELKQENVQASGFADTKLQNLSRLSNVDLPSDQLPQKPQFQIETTECIVSDKLVPTDDTLPKKIINEMPLEPEHGKLSRTEMEVSNDWNQWEFLSTAATNLVNPVTFMSQSKQPEKRLHKKLVVRKPAYKTKDVDAENAGLISAPSTFTSTKLAKISTSSILRNVPFHPAELIDAVLKAPLGSTDSVLNAPVKEMLPKPKSPRSSTDMLPHIPRASANGNQLKPAIEKPQNKKSHSVDDFPGEPLCQLKCKPAEKLHKQIKLTTSIAINTSPKAISKEVCMGFSEVVEDKSPSSKVGFDTFHAGKPHVTLHTSVEKGHPEHVDEQSPPFLQLNTPSADMLYKSIPEGANMNQPEFIKENLHPFFGLKNVLPADIQKNEFDGTKEQQYEPENEKLLPSVKAHMLKTVKGDLSNRTEDLRHPPLLEGLHFHEICSEILYDSSHNNRSKPSTEKSPHVSDNKAPLDVSNAFESNMVPKPNPAENSPSPTRQENIIPSEKHHPESVDDAMNVICAQTLPSAPCDLLDKNRHRQSEGHWSATKTGSAFPAEILLKTCEDDELMVEPVQDGLPELSKMEDPIPVIMLQDSSPSSPEKIPSSPRTYSYKVANKRPCRLRMSTLRDEARKSTPRDEVNIIQVPRRSRSMHALAEKKSSLQAKAGSALAIGTLTRTRERSKRKAEPACDNLPKSTKVKHPFPLKTPTRHKRTSKLEDKKSPNTEHSRKTADGKPRKLRMMTLVNEANIIQVPRKSRSPLTRSKSKLPRRTSQRLASNQTIKPNSQPVKPIITYKRKRRHVT